MTHYVPEKLLFPRFITICWYITAGITWIGLIASLPGYYLWNIEQPIRMQVNSTQMVFAWISGLASFSSGLISLALGTLLFLRKAVDRTALFVSFFLLLYGFVMSGPIERIEYTLFGQSGVYSYWIQGIFFAPLTIFLLLIFPNGIITPAWFRWLIPFILFLLLIYALLGSDVTKITSLNSQLTYAFTVALYLCALGGQVYRYLRKSSQIERQQTKIVIYGVSIQALCLLIASASFVQLPESAQISFVPDLIPSDLFWWISIAILPVVLTLAVVRSHLWDIDIVIRRTLVYGFLSAALALVYFGSVILMQYSFRLMIGHESSLAIVISTLAIAALFQPLRGRIQAVIDRRFFRSKYNSEQALARFQKTVRDRVDLDQVGSELTGIVQTTVQPEWMVIWIRKPGKEG